MNKTLHLIKKDLRICMWWLLLWTILCLTHFGLRMRQLSFGDTVMTSGFWSHLETTDRLDWQALRWMPLLIIPFFMHADPLVKRYAFWKSLPINRWRLVFAKLAIVITFFVILPFVLEFIYLRAAGLTPMLGEALMMWGLRFLPLVVAVTLACYLTPGMLWGLPAAALLFVLFGRVTPTPKFSRAATKSAVVSAFLNQPPGYRLAVDPNSGKVETGTETYIDSETGKQRRKETSHFSVTVRAESLPEGVLIGSIDCQFGELVMPDRTMKLESWDGEILSRWTLGNLPVQETSRQSNSGLCDLRNPRNEWSFSTGGAFSARVIPVEGGELKGTVRAVMVRKVVLKEMDVTTADHWVNGLERFNKRPAKNTIPGAFSIQTSYHMPLSIQNLQHSGGYPLQESRFISGGGTIMLAPEHSCTWIIHKTLPYGRIMSGSTNTIVDMTRCRSLSTQEFPLSSRQELLPRMAPLARLRYLDEQSGPENWKLQFVRYEALGRIDIPFSVHVKRPQSLPVILQEGDIETLGELPPSFESQLAEIELPETPSADDTRRALAALTEICVNRSDLDKHDPKIIPLLERMASAHPAILLEETKRAADRLEKPRDPGYFIREYNADGFNDFGSEAALWQERHKTLNGYWQRMISALVRTSKPERKELFLRYHSPRIDLMDAIHLNGWEQDALSLMQGIAMREPVTASWPPFIINHPSVQSSAALLAQIRMGSCDFYRILDFIDSGLVEGAVAANAAWDATVERAIRMQDVRDSFLLAVKYGVESAPRDLTRIIKSGMLDRDSEKAENLRLLLSMLQALSVRSDCPVTLPEGTAWLEENAFSLSWNPVSRRYESSGTNPGRPWADPPEPLGKWIDPMGIGTFKIDGNEIRMSSRALSSYCSYRISERPIARLMKEVNGDFTAEVTVDFQFKPSVAWSGKDNDMIQSAGLLVEEGRYNFLRLFREFSGRDSKALLREQIRRIANTTDVDVHNPTWIPAEPVTFRICRHGDWFYTAWKQENGPWNESAAQYNAGWGQIARVGPYISSRLIQPFEVRYTGFSVSAGSEPPRNARLGKFGTAGAVPTLDGTELAGWGVVRNPRKNGEFHQAGEKLTIRSAAEIGNWRLDRSISAPAVLKPVSGNFVYEVTAGPAPDAEWSSALVVLCDHSKTFSYSVGNGTREVGKRWLNQVIWTGGDNIWPKGPLYPIDHKKPLRIRMEREDKLLRVFARQDGDKDWRPLTSQVLAYWPKELEVGVAAANSGRTESIMEFSNPVLVQEPNQTAR